MQGVSLSGSELGWSLAEAGSVVGMVSMLGGGGYLIVAAAVGIFWSAISHICSLQEDARLVSAMVQFGQDSGFWNLMEAKASIRALLNSHQIDNYLLTLSTLTLKTTLQGNVCSGFQKGGGLVKKRLTDKTRPWDHTPRTG